MFLWELITVIALVTLSGTVVSEILNVHRLTVISGDNIKQILEEVSEGCNLQ